jgi:hypothetical protein
MAKSSNQAILDDLMREHVPYEIWMMHETHDMVLTRAVVPRPLMNACLESFAIHARALIEFFNGRKGSDARYFTVGTYIPFKGGPIPSALTDKLNQQIPHITEKRFTTTHEKFNSRDMVALRALLDPEVEEFVRSMKASYVSIWDRDKLLL